MTRLIEPYIRRDSISWWAGCRYADRGTFEDAYISEEPCLTRWGAVYKSHGLAARARRLRDEGMENYVETTGEPK